MKNKDLFIYDPKTGKVKITKFAKKFYEDKGLDPKVMAKQWLARLGLAQADGIEPPPPN